MPHSGSRLWDIQQMTDASAMGFAVQCTGSELGVRDALQQVMQTLQDQKIASDTCGDIELALAELLNNVVEHALDGIENGTVEIHARQEEGDLCLTVFDNGRPMPDGALPEGNPADVELPLQELPEGGFGWFLIRDLTRDITYRRVGRRNRVDMWFALPGGKEAAH